MRPSSGSTVPTDDAPSPAAAGPDGPTASPHADRLVQVARWAAIGLPAVVLMWAGWARRWTTDDGFINYRIVHMLVQGHGPVYNVGQRVEAYTSPLWLGILSVGDLLLPLRLEYVAIALSIPLAGLGVLAMGVGARRLWQQPKDRWWLPFGTIVVLAIAPMWDFTTSGLEFGLTLAWLGGLVWVLGRWSDEERPLTNVEAIIVGLGPLVRPDTTLYTITVLALVVALRWRSESWRDRTRVVVVALAIPVAYELFRMAYFAALVPNTALAKGADVPHWSAGWDYLRNLVGTYLLLIPLALLVVAGVLLARSVSARRRLVLAVLPATALLQTIGIVHAGGDYIHARLLLPAVVAFVAPLAVVPLRRTLVVPAAAIVLWGLVAATSLRMDKPLQSGRTIIANGRSIASGATGVANPVTTEQIDNGDVQIIHQMKDGVWNGVIRTSIVPKPGLRTPVSAMFGIGIGGYAGGARLDVLDRLGLADALASRMEVRHPGFIGHEKVLPDAWIIARVTDGDVAPGTFTKGLFATPLYESPKGRLDADADVARAVLECKSLRRLQDATTDPLTVGRALHNIVDSFSLTRLKVPPDPNEAQRKLC